MDFRDGIIILHHHETWRDAPLRTGTWDVHKRSGRATADFRAAATRLHCIEPLGIPGPSGVSRCGKHRTQARFFPCHMLLRLPTAVLLLWDELAPRAIAAIRDTRREVPHDVPLISFNNDELCTLIPPASLDRPVGRRSDGRSLVRLLAERINCNTPIPSPMLIPSRFINRATTTSPIK